MTALKAATRDAVLQRMAGEEEYRRGYDYFHLEHVLSMANTPKGIRAVVRGSREYNVTLTLEDGLIDYTCDCGSPAFCKHCVAAALAWRNGALKPKPVRVKKVTLTDAAKVLEDEEHGRLVRMVLEWAKADKQFESRLIQFTARRLSPEAAAAEAVRVFEKAVKVRRFLTRSEATKWGRAVNEAVDHIEALLKDGHAGAVMRAADAALEIAEPAGMWLRGNEPFDALLIRLRSLHLMASHQVHPAPAALAATLLNWALMGHFDIAELTKSYDDLLRPEGIEELRRLARLECRKSHGPDERWSRKQARTEVVGWIARETGDVDLLVSALSDFLHLQKSYVEIVESLHGARRADEAVEWAEKGLKAFFRAPDERLVEFLVTQYKDAGREKEALNVLSTAFFAQPTIDAYHRLSAFARNTPLWEGWKRIALTEARAEAMRNRPKPEFSLLLKIHLDEGELDAAWELAINHDCSVDALMELAHALEPDKPAQAGGIYLRIAEWHLRYGPDFTYNTAVDLLIKAGQLMKAAGLGAEYAEAFSMLRTHYKHYTRFMIALQRRSLELG